MGVIDITQSETQIVFTRHYHAPKDIVFTAFSRAEHLQQWWGAEGWHMSECSVDFRPGGEWLYALKNKEGEEHWAKAVYQEIIPGAKIVFLANFVSAGRQAIASLPQHRTTITFDQDGAETILVVTVDYATNELKKQHAAMGFVNGFSYALTKLDAAIGYITQA